MKNNTKSALVALSLLSLFSLVSCEQGESAAVPAAFGQKQAASLGDLYVHVRSYLKAEGADAETIEECIQGFKGTFSDLELDFDDNIGSGAALIFQPNRQILTVSSFHDNNAELLFEILAEAANEHDRGNGEFMLMFVPGEGFTLTPLDPSYKPTVPSDSPDADNGMVIG